MTALLEVDRLDISYPVRRSFGGRLRGAARSLRAVIDVSLSLAAGETLAIVGESGSGKTSLGRGILRLLPVAGGSIRFNGTEISTLSEAELKPYRRAMAMMFQDPVSSLSPRKKVGSLIAEPFAIHGMHPTGGSKAEAERLLQVVGLSPSFADRYPHQLSGGQARRVGIARALALSPKLVIADEPTAGLDISVQGGIMNLMSGLKRDLGMAMVLITHNLALVRHVSDRLAIMYLGQLVEYGATASVLAQPAHPYTKALLMAQPSPGAAEERIKLQGDVTSQLHRPTGCAFHPRCWRARAECGTATPQFEKRGDRSFACHYPLVG